MNNTQTLVLDAQQMEQKIKRMAWELYEQNHNEENIIIAGIAKRGYVLAERIASILSEISNIQVKLLALRLDKDNPLNASIESDAVDFSDQTVVLVDDVLKSGKTLMYGTHYFMRQPLKKLTTAILIDRNYKCYPIKADVVGLSLSTTMQEHVSVELGENQAVYLQ